MRGCLPAQPWRPSLPRRRRTSGECRSERDKWGRWIGSCLIRQRCFPSPVPLPSVTSKPNRAGPRTPPEAGRNWTRSHKMSNRGRRERQSKESQCGVKSDFIMLSLLLIRRSTEKLWFGTEVDLRKRAGPESYEFRRRLAGRQAVGNSSRSYRCRKPTRSELLSPERRTM